MDPQAEDYEYRPELEGAINATDRVYRNTQTGRWFKVRCKRVPHARFGVVVVEVSVAHCNEDGSAKQHGENAWQIAPAHRVTFMPDVAVDLEQRLEDTRKARLILAELAVANEEQGAALPG